MTHWIRFQHAGATGFGTIESDRIAVHEGTMFDAPTATGEHLSLDQVTPLAPTAAGKMLALWNNFHALATKLNQEVPAEPLYFIKADGSYLGTGAVIRKPPSYDGKVVFEGELISHLRGHWDPAARKHMAEWMVVHGSKLQD